MYHQYSSRDLGGKGFKAKHAFQVALLLAISIWSVYQIKNNGMGVTSAGDHTEKGLGEASGVTSFGRKVKLELINEVDKDSNYRKDVELDQNITEKNEEPEELEANVSNHEEEEDEKVQETQQEDDQKESEEENSDSQIDGSEKNTKEEDNPLEKLHDTNGEYQVNGTEGDENEPKTKQDHEAKDNEEETSDSQNDGREEDTKEEENPHEEHQNNGEYQANGTEGDENDPETQPAEQEEDEKVQETCEEEPPSNEGNSCGAQIRREEREMEREVPKEELQSSEQVKSNSNSVQEEFMDENGVPEDVSTDLLSFLANDTTSENHVVSSAEEKTSDFDIQNKRVNEIIPRVADISSSSFVTEQNMEMQLAGKEPVQKVAVAPHELDDTHEAETPNHKSDEVQGSTKAWVHVETISESEETDEQDIQNTS